MKKTSKKFSILLFAVLLIIPALSPFTFLAESKEIANILGDVNADGVVTAIDARMALRYSADLSKLTAEQKKAADLNDDSKVDANDARGILMISAELETAPFKHPDKSVFTLSLDPLPKTDFKVGESLKLKAHLKNTSERGYKIVSGMYPVEAGLTREGSSGYAILAIGVDRYFKSGETLSAGIIALADETSQTMMSKEYEEYTFTKAGTYTLNVKSSFSIPDFSGKMQTYSYSLEPITITVTE